MYAFRNWLISGITFLTMLTAPTGSLAGNMPDSIDLGSLENLYGKVKFNHAAHVTLAGDCSVCHHHTTGTPVQDANCVRCHKNSGATAVVACKGCHDAHPFSAASLLNKSKTAYHTDRLGLKGAYHQNCTGCHSKMGGPTGCRDCHERTKGGDAFYSAGANAPPQAPGKANRRNH
jgi:hypothetical protein